MEYSETIKKVREVDLNSKDFKARFADSVILTHDNKILIQYRPPEWSRNADGLNLFGGYVEPNETVEQAIVRELNEELGAVARIDDMHFLGAVTEEFTNHEEIVHVYFWHDKEGTITGCYEAEARHYDSVAEAINEPKLMDYAVWALKRAHEQGLLTA